MSDRVILLDLGGVLINVVSAQRLAAMMDPSLGLEEVQRRWSQSRYLRLFECGRCSRTVFAREIVRELGLAVEPETFISAFDLFLEGFYPGAEALLDRLSRSGHRLACLTDTNLSQWSSLCKRLSVDRYFSHCFLSCEIGRQKPDPQVYRTVIGSLGCAPGEIVYFDDRMVNVQAGARSGMDAHQVDGVRALEQKLQELQLL